MSDNNKNKMVKTYLDDAPWGSEEFLEEERKKSRRERRKLPEGCDSRVLYRDIFAIAWPSLLELTLASLVSMADMVMVGSMANGDNAISAVSLAANPKFIFISLLQALNIGVTAAVARDRGAQLHEKANDSLRQGLFLSFMISIFATVVGFIFSKPLVRFMATSALDEEIIEMSTQYLQIQFLGFITMGVTATFTAAFRGTGNSKLPMVYGVTSNLVNIVLNYLLINGHFGFPALGVVGASLATVIGQGAALIIAIRATGSGKYYYTVHLKDFLHFKPDLEAIGRIVKVGLPSLGEQAIIRTGIILFARQVAALGQPSFTTHNVCMNVQSLSFMLGMGFAVSSTTMVGQSLGKLRPDLAEHYSRRSMRLSLALSCVLGLFFAFFGKYVVMLYSDTPEVIAQSVPVMIIVGILQPIQTPGFVLSGSLRGAGATKMTAFITLVGTLVLRPVVGWLCIQKLGWGLLGAWAAISADQIVRTVLIMAFYAEGKWKTIKV